jgi:hypothetical protein
MLRREEVLRHARQGVIACRAMATARRMLPMVVEMVVDTSLRIHKEKRMMMERGAP